MLVNFDQLRQQIVPVLVVLLALVLIWLLRRLLIMILIRPLRKLLEKSGRDDIDAMIDSIVVTPVRILVIAFSIFIAAQLLTLDGVTRTFVLHLTRTLVIIDVALIVYRIVTQVFLTRGRLYSITGIVIEEALLPFARTGLQIIILAISLVIIIQEWGYDVSGLIAGLGIGGLSLSLAAQDTLSNLFGFTAIVGDRPFAVGEAIKTKDVEGTIEHVGLRSTRVRQMDQAVVTVPNSMLASSAILNWSRLSKRQINLTLGISYGASAQELETLLQRLRDLLANWEKVEEKSVIVHLVNFGERSLEILVRSYLQIADWTEFTREKERILLAIMRIVEEMGLQISVANPTLYIESLGEIRTHPHAEISGAADGREDEVG